MRRSGMLDVDPDDLASKAITFMLAALRAGSVEDAISIGEKAEQLLRASSTRQSKVLDHWADTDETRESATATGSKRRETQRRKPEQDREQLFKIARPETLLSPANVVAVFLHNNPMWESWDWSATTQINVEMLPVAHQVHQGDPLPTFDRYNITSETDLQAAAQLDAARKAAVATKPSNAATVTAITKQQKPRAARS
jgi:hypothetical protein